MRFSCWAVRQRVSPGRGEGDLGLTSALLVYMYSSMESVKQRKLCAGTTNYSLGQIGTSRGQLPTSHWQLGGS